MVPARCTQAAIHRWTDHRPGAAAEVHGRDISERSAQQGDTALILAAKRGEKEVVALLLDHGAEVNAKNEKGPTALHTGCDALMKRPRARSCCSSPRTRHL